MFLKSIELVNIRSYISETINLGTTGITVLAGDIGSGKTTILLGIEFALFGLLRGKINPGELLRHGEKEGSVTLKFNVDGKEVIIQRTLKRSKNNISQGAGFISINDTKIDTMATESKAKILELLGYPQELISKSTNLFRYTVYTPQENIKQILFENADERKDTLRKIFQMDNYKRVQENLTTYLTELRSAKDKLEGELSAFENLNEQLNEINSNIESEIKNRELKKIEHKKIENNLNSKKDEFQKIQTEIKEYEEIIKETNILQKQLKTIEEQILIHNNQIKKSKEDISNINILNGDEEISIEKIKENIIKAENNIDKVIQKKRILTDEISKENTIINQHGEMYSKIIHLDNCPTCKQEVSMDHKRKISYEANQKISSSKEKKEKHEISLKEIDEKENEIKSMLIKFRNKLNEMQINEQKKKNLEQLKKHIEQREKELASAKNSKNETLEILTKNKNKIAMYDDILKKHNIIKLELDKVVVEERNSVQEIAINNSRIEQFQKQKSNIEKTIIKVQNLKKKKENIQENNNWLTTKFLPIIKTIEKKVLLSIYNECNISFKEWFKQLIEDDSLNARLDEDFLPVIEQNGYETTIENLSGGEKTAVAIAYRLSLNKVLNDLFSHIKTKDLLILDEPTEGFSSHQLDRLQDVLQSLSLKQIIIVSHEQKVESLATKVIRVSKSENTSKIFA